MAWRRADGRIGVRNHVAILPLDDISNAACEAVAAPYPGNDRAAARLRPAAVRRGPGADLPHPDRHGRQPQRRRLRRDRHRAAAGRRGWSRGSPRRASRSPASPSRAPATSPRSPPPHTPPRRTSTGPASSCASPSRSPTCGSPASAARATPPPGLASCPTVGDMYDKLIPAGLTGCFGETSELTGAEHLAAARAADPGHVADKFMRTWTAYQRDVIEAHKTERPQRQPADKGQHRRRPHHHRGEGARQPGEDRAQSVHLHRRAGAR